MNRAFIQMAYFLSVAFTGTTALATQPVPSAVAATIHSVQPPAWIFRDNKRYPAAPGVKIIKDDYLLTDRQGRIHLALANGLLARIGSSSRAGIINHSNYGATAIRLAFGTLRITDEMGFSSNQQQLNIITSHGTIHVHSGDLFATSATNETVVAMIEGEVTISSGSSSRIVSLSQPLSVTRLPNLDTLPVATRDATAGFPDRVRQTDIDADSIAVTPEGAWSAHLVSLPGINPARDIARLLRRYGYPVDLRKISSGEKTWYRLSVDRLQSRHAALLLSERLKAWDTIKTPWVEQTGHQ
ncbi:MAG: FecR domain-containing protein [Gammaproteobacteria bacterium]|nr:FecR domain-containing protein [Gammaproteobacteria bacterium]